MMDFSIFSFIIQENAIGHFFLSFIMFKCLDAHFREGNFFLNFFFCLLIHFLYQIMYGAMGWEKITGRVRGKR